MKLTMWLPRSAKVVLDPPATPAEVAWWEAGPRRHDYRVIDVSIALSAVGMAIGGLVTWWQTGHGLPGSPAGILGTALASMGPVFWWFWMRTWMRWAMKEQLRDRSIRDERLRNAIVTEAARGAAVGLIRDGRLRYRD